MTTTYDLETPKQRLLVFFMCHGPAVLEVVFEDLQMKEKKKREPQSLCPSGGETTKR